MLTSISRPDRIPIPMAALLAAGLLLTAPAPPLAGQEEVVDTRTVIMNVRETRENGILNDAQVEALRPLACAVPGLLQAINASGSAEPEHEGGLVDTPVQWWWEDTGSSAVGEFCRGEVPETVTTDYTVYIHENRMAVHSEGFAMVWRVIPGSQAQMYFYDPETGQIQRLGRMFGEVPIEAVNLQAVDRETAMSGQLRYLTPYEGPDGEHLGYPVDRYSFVDHVRVSPELGVITPVIETFGAMRVAPDTPFNEVVGRFFQNFATHVDSGSGGLLGALTGRMSATTNRAGLPMVTKDTTIVTIEIPDMDEISAADDEPDSMLGIPTRGLVVKRTFTETEVTDIRFGTYEIEDLEEIFGPEQDETLTQGAGGTDENPGDRPAPCDCSCRAFNELKDLDQDDPAAMEKAMCARQCMPQWVRQCVGSGCSGS